MLTATPTPAMIDLAARFAAAHAAYLAAYAPVAELNTAVAATVADALRGTPAYAAYAEAKAADDAAEALWRVADKAEREADKIARAPYNVTNEAASRAHDAAMLAAKRLKDPREREVARSAAREALASETLKASTAYGKALTESGHSALRAEASRLYEVWDALTPALRSAHSVLRDEAEALIAALPYPEQDRKSLLTAVWRNLFPAP